MTQQERIACILWFTYNQGWADHIASRLGVDREPAVPYVTDEMMEEWDECDPEVKARFLRSAEDFCSKEDFSAPLQPPRLEVTSMDLAAEALKVSKSRRK